jgi:hypothetical protein
MKHWKQASHDRVHEVVNWMVSSLTILAVDSPAANHYFALAEGKPCAFQGVNLSCCQIQ